MAFAPARIVYCHLWYWEIEDISSSCLDVLINLINNHLLLIHSIKFYQTQFALYQICISHHWLPHLVAVGFYVHNDSSLRYRRYINHLLTYLLKFHDTSLIELMWCDMICLMSFCGFLVVFYICIFVHCVVFVDFITYCFYLLKKLCVYFCYVLINYFLLIYILITCL